MTTVLVLNGPNLGRLGVREPEVYGSATLADLPAESARWGAELGLDVEVRQTDDEAELVGWLQPPQGAAGELDADPDDDVLPTLRVADLLQRVDVDLYGAYVVDREPDPGLEPASLTQLPDAGSLTGARNLFYALEWWFFGCFAVFIWIRWVRDERAAATAPALADDSVGAE